MVIERDKNTSVVWGSFVDVVQWRASQHPERQAYTFLHSSDGIVNITYGELDRQARAIGGWLQSFVAPGERALLLYSPSIEYITAFLGCLYAGVIAVPAYPPHPNRPISRILSILDDSDIKVLLSNSSILANIEQFLEQHPELTAVRCLSTDELPKDSEHAWKMPTINGETIAFLQYTSGSTAIPKGVMVSHKALLHNQTMIMQSFALTEQTTHVSWLPLYHDMGLIGNVLGSLHAGSQAVLMSPMTFLQRPIRWLQAISDYKAHTSGGPNFAYDLCVSKITPDQCETLDLSSWQRAFNGSEPVRAVTLQRFTEKFEPYGFHHTAFYPCYGLAEATLFVSGRTETTIPPRVQQFRSDMLEQGQAVEVTETNTSASAFVSCGQTWLEQDIDIVNPETGLFCQPGHIGEIWVSGPNITKGYWNRDEETAHTFHAMVDDNKQERVFLRTGDLGFMYQDELYIAGRIKDLIIIEGRNHYPQDIELTVEQCHEAIRTGCVAAFAVDTSDGEQLVVVAEINRRYQPHQANPTDDATEVVKMLTKVIRQAIAQHHDIKTHAIKLLQSGSIPKTSSGKIQRHACRKQYLNDTLDIWNSKV